VQPRSPMCAAHCRYCWLGQAPCCMQCGERFGLMVRRHHCQLCGVVICGDCITQGLPGRPNIKSCLSCKDFNVGKHTLMLTVRPAPVEVFRGWMVKQGGLIKSWKRRLFVLDSNGVLSYFKNDPDLAKAGTTSSSSGTINTVRISPHPPSPPSPSALPRPLLLCRVYLYCSSSRFSFGCACYGSSLLAAHVMVVLFGPGARLILNCSSFTVE
jgi:hypothetical protein